MNLEQLIKLLTSGAMMVEAIGELLDTHQDALTMGDLELEAAFARFATANDQLAARTQAKLRG